MKDQDKTKAQLIEELDRLRKKISEYETSERHQEDYDNLELEVLPPLSDSTASKSELTEFPARLADPHESTQTIDLVSLFTRDVSSSGSFDIRGDIWATTFGKLLQALPIPAILIDHALYVVVANQACGRISPDYEEILGLPFYNLISTSEEMTSMHYLLGQTFADRKPRIHESKLHIGNQETWGRITFRSVRIMKKRYLLAIVEDLTRERIQESQNVERQKELETEIVQRKTAEKESQKLLAELNQKIDELAIEISKHKQTQEALVESENRLRRMAEVTFEGIVFHEDGNLLYANTQFYQMFDYEPEELINRQAINILIASESRSTVMKHINSGYLGTYEAVGLKKDGTRFSMELRVRSAEFEGRTVRAAAIRDVTEQKKAQQALKESEEQFRALYENAPVMIDAFSPDGSLLLWNLELEKTLGWTKEEAQARDILALVYPDPTMCRQVREAIHLADGQFRKCTATAKDGSHHTQLWANFSLPNGNTISVGYDITEKEKAETALQESEELYRRLVETTDTGYVVIDYQGRVLDANAEYVRLTGYHQLNDIMGRSVLEWTAKHDRDRNYVAVKKCLEEGVVRNLEIDYVDNMGTVIPIEINATTVDTKKGKQILGLCRDITYRRESEEHLKTSLKEKEILLREIHHRVKNNLAIVNSLMRLQSRYATDEFHRQLFASAQSRIRSMSLAHEMLYQSDNLARLKASDYLASLVDHLVIFSGKISPKIQLIKEIADISLQLDTAIPLGFIVSELVSNALRHAFPSEVGGTVSVSLQTLEGDELELIIKDDGIGLPKDLDPSDPQTFGFKLINLFSDQLNGKFRVSTENGTEIRLVFRSSIKRYENEE